MALHRRKMLALCCTTAAAGLAGCTGDSGNPVTGGDEKSHEHIADGSVDYPGMVDGGASVETGDAVTVQYEDPKASFFLQSVYEGQEGPNEELQVTRDLSGETMAAFLAPVHADGAFEFHVFVNQAFVDFAEWNVVVFGPDGLVSGDNPGFEQLEGDIHGMVLSPGEVTGIGLVDETVEELQNGGGENATGVVAINEAPPQPEQTPQTAPTMQMSFSYDMEAERLEATHSGGDDLDAEKVSFRSDVDITVEQAFEGTVTAGDTAVISAPPDATVLFIWISGDNSATLARWEGPDA